LTKFGFHFSNELTFGYQKVDFSTKKKKLLFSHDCFSFSNLHLRIVSI